ncbi:MAG: glycine dehydrogenase (aminomethyl-transferring), partial [Bacteroidia bacterium]|nr:glycine dehydrogenase (aminomethyl-transferring) [Bacteroidia bacterium]
MPTNEFKGRHIGPDSRELNAMLQHVGVNSLDELIDLTVPASIRSEKELDIPEAQSEYEYLRHLKKIAQKNKIHRSYIGQGYYGTLTPSVILRNIFENPAWYTQYTPYQAEISQGRLEALLNFQTAIMDLTGMPLANASLLDEGTAAAEAMIMASGIYNKKKKGAGTKFFIDKNIFQQTKDVVIGRAMPLNIEVIEGNWNEADLDESYFGALVQYPDSLGSVNSYKSFADSLHEKNQLLVAAADILSLAVIQSPGSWGADVVVGNTQRFGVPMGFGGPHAAYFATTEKYKRQIPGRIIGVSQDRLGNPALRMALQTREQHIKREKATSNICTAQALLAIMASMYACYHGPDGIRAIAERIHDKTNKFQQFLKSRGYKILNDTYFDTLTIEAEKDDIEEIRTRALKNGFNFFYNGNTVSISFDETVTHADLEDLKSVFENNKVQHASNGVEYGIPQIIQREVDYMDHPVFNSHHTETKMMRYIKSLENKDLSLVHSMIPLGSCTMKLNAATELIPVSWPEF